MLILKIIVSIFIYLAVLGLSCGCGIFGLCSMRVLQFCHADSWLQLAVSSSLSRDQTQAFCIGSEVLATVSPRKSLTVVFS